MSWAYYMGGTPPKYAPAVSPSPIVRIPIAGPGRFNTLAVLRHRWNIVEQTGPADGELHRWTITVATPLKIPGYTPELDTSEQVRHSTSANLFAYQAGPEVSDGPIPTADDGAEFTWAVDRIHDEVQIVGEDAQVALRIDVAYQSYQVLSNAFIEASSWVMYHDPTPPQEGTLLSKLIKGEAFELNSRTAARLGRADKEG